MKKTTNFIYVFMLIGMLNLLTNSCKHDDINNNENPPIILPNCGTVADVDGNIYNTVTIGNQCWMKENLKVTHYRNGDPIPNVTDDVAWIGLTTGAYCNYNNDTNNVTTYGRLYNCFAVNDSRNIAPTGWHVPTDAEWTTLTTFLGGDSIAGGKLKETGTTHWLTPNEGATNETGFTALPGGNRGHDGVFDCIGYAGMWWSASEYSAFYAWRRSMNFWYSDVFGGLHSKDFGSSVRCVRD